MQDFETDPKYRWDKFFNYCGEQGISLDHIEDWGPWWHCWTHAIDVATKEVGHASV